MVAAVLCGVTNPRDVPRSVCAMGHKWMWNESLGGLPSEEFLTGVDPLLAGVREKLGGRYATSDKIAGHLSNEWAMLLGLRPGIPIPTGAFDAHWDAIGAGLRLGSVVNVVGTATCIMAISESAELIPGVCGVVNGSIYPDRIGVEAGLSATGDLFGAIAKRCNTKVSELARGLENYRAGETGLLRLTWDNGDRTVLVNPELGGVMLGSRLTTTAQDELFAAIEGCAMHTRVILERMQQHGVPIDRIIHGGGIPQKNPVLNQVYANVMGKPILVPKGDVTSLGSAIFAFLAIGTFKSIEEAQDALCPGFNIVEPQPEAVATYQELFDIYKRLYFAMGQRKSDAIAIGDVLPELRRIAASVQSSKGAACCRSSARRSLRSQSRNRPPRSCPLHLRQRQRRFAGARPHRDQTQRRALRKDDARRSRHHRPRRPCRRGFSQAVVRSRNPRAALSILPIHRRSRAHSFPPRHRLVAGSPRNPMLRHHARRLFLHRSPRNRRSDR